MNSKNLIIFGIILIIFLINPANASNVAGSRYTLGSYPVDINSSTYYDLNTQLIIKIPFESLNGIRYVDGIKFLLTKSYLNNPNAPLNMRMYYYDESNYYYVDNINIPNNTGNEMWITVSHNQLNVNQPGYDGIAYGFYSLASVGYYYIYYSTNTESGIKNSKIYNYYDHITTNYSIDIRDVNNSLMYNTEHSNYMYYFNIESLKGQFRIPPTPIPTPTVVIPSNGTNPIPDDCSFEDLINNLCDTSTVPEYYEYIDFNETLDNITNTSCPECLGNETIIPDKIPGDKDSSRFLTLLGYCDKDGCNIFDILDFGYDLSILIFVLTFYLILNKFFFNKR